MADTVTETNRREAERFGQGATDDHVVVLGDAASHNRTYAVLVEIATIVKITLSLIRKYTSTHIPKTHFSHKLLLNSNVKVFLEAWINFTTSNPKKCPTSQYNALKIDSLAEKN